MTTATVDIRHAVPTDAPALAALSGQLGYPVAVDALAASLWVALER